MRILDFAFDNGKKCFSFPKSPDRIWALPTSCSLGIRALSLADKLARGKADHLPPFSNDVKSEWSYNSAPPIRLLCVFRYKLTPLVFIVPLSEIFFHSKLVIIQYGA